MLPQPHDPVIVDAAHLLPIIAEETLQDVLNDVAAMRAAYANLQAQLHIAILDRDTTPEGQRVKDIHAEANAMQEELEQAEERAKALAIEQYQATGDKKPAIGVSIREYTTLVYDEDQAFKWALEHAQICLTLDKARFKAVSEDVTEDWCVKMKEPKAILARNIGTFA